MFCFAFMYRLSRYIWFTKGHIYLYMKRILECPFAYDSLILLRWPFTADSMLKIQLRINHPQYLCCQPDEYNCSLLLQCSCSNWQNNIKWGISPCSEMKWRHDTFSCRSFCTDYHENLILVVTGYLQRLYLHFWRVDAVLQGGYHGWR